MDTKPIRKRGVKEVLIAVVILFALWWLYGSITLGGSFAGYLLLLALIFLYLFPTYTAWSKKKTNLESIAILNIFLGWSIVGWVVALIWATKKDSSATSTVDQLHKLSELREKNLISEAEFESQKEKLL